MFGINREQLFPVVKNNLCKNKLTSLFLNFFSNDSFESNIIDIYSKGKFPSNVLSNFHESKFKFDGVQIYSMEGFLQSLKTSDINLQRKICQLIGSKAKEAGNMLSEHYDRKNIYWNGQNIDRFSDDYETLLKKVYKAKFDQDDLFREAILASKDKKLVHSIGKLSKEETILTEQEFISIIEWLRQFL